MILGLLKEYGTETRVALLPETVKAFTDLKVEVLVEQGAGENAFAADADYVAVGAKIVSRADVFSKAEVLLQIQPPADGDTQKIKNSQVWISAFNPLWDTKLVKTFLEKGITSFSLDLIPRTTRAQAMDILSSMATVAGYQAVLEAAALLPTFFPMFMTAAGTIRPANMLILGAGVAGLQAIATSRKLGAQVQVFDVRSAVKEEVKSLGGKFVEVEGAVEDKAAGGYAVEQTASSGGNCELTKDNETVVHKGVTIIGQSNYPAKKPVDASRMFGKNVLNFMKLIIGAEGVLNLNFEDDIVKGTCITNKGEIYNERVKSIISTT